MKILSDEAIKEVYLVYASKQYGEEGARYLIEHLPDCNYGKAVAQEQDKYTMRQVAEYIEAHSALERLPYRDGGEWLRTIPESSWQEIKKLAEREL